MIIHTSPAAQAVFERETGLILGTYDDFVCIIHVPSDSDSLGMTLFVRAHTASNSSAHHLQLYCPRTSPPLFPPFVADARDLSRQGALRG